MLQPPGLESGRGKWSRGRKNCLGATRYRGVRDQRSRRRGNSRNAGGDYVVDGEDE
jgi:hypothetical protein